MEKKVKKWMNDQLAQGKYQEYGIQLTELTEAAAVEFNLDLDDEHECEAFYWAYQVGEKWESSGRKLEQLEADSRYHDDF